MDPLKDKTAFIYQNKNENSYGLGKKESTPTDSLEVKKWSQRKTWIWLGVIFVAVVLVSAGFLFFKAGFVLNKVSTQGGLFDSLAHIVAGKDDKLKGEEQGRINVLLLGMRGQELEGGGLLADTIMVASIDPVNKRASLFSVPRDLYVSVPNKGFQSKLNSVYFYGEEEKAGKGMENMKRVIGEIMGSEIHYAVSINFKGFEELVDSLGGINIELKEPFVEPLQFKEEHVCDPNVFTVPSGNYQYKKNEKGKIVAQYPLCYNKNLECGGVFELPAGNLTLNGEKALCYVRSRVTSSDFERARRQQEVIKKIKEKATSAGTLSDFNKINKILDSLGNNTKTDMKVWEMKRFFELYQQLGDMALKQRVLEDSEEGLLYNPKDSDPAVGYILLPRGDNYSKIQEAFRNILN